MATVNFITPPIHPEKYSGGMLCISQYAKGLCDNGHTVRIIPILPGKRPLWIDSRIGFITQEKRKSTLSKRKSLTSTLTDRARLIPKIKELVGSIICRVDRRLLPQEIRFSSSLIHVKNLEIDGDITVATSYETALPTALYGSGRLFYFCQHYEPYFKNESDNPILAEKLAKQSYQLDLQLIANSTWLMHALNNKHTEQPVALCPNAIDHNIFDAQTPLIKNLNNNEIRVISYGGRNAEWKGFKDMAKAIKLARNKLSDINIIWQVYGDALLPPDNDIATYEALGFLKQTELVKYYQQSDILLSASWYESFPLFPLEAMACGLATITSQYGTEEFAFAGETAEIVEPNNIDSITNGLIKLITDSEYRSKLSSNGTKISQKFTWKNSTARMEEILFKEHSNQ